ncbi:MAG TPA: hypothetical protein VFH33_08810 [Candidatus Krumholzibacteria bacterium]|nr:hypothetical protein [Candidatus Krumholzibacteria bacterium]
MDWKRRGTRREWVRGASQIVVCMAIVFAAGCSKKSQRAEHYNDQGSVVTEETKTPAVRMPYVIAEAGIHFNPPLAWDPDRIQVVTVSGEEAAAEQPGADYAVSFNYKAEQPAHQNEPLLKLYVLRRAQWDRVANNNAHGEIIDSTGEWVFVAAPSKEIPYRTDLLDADQFAAMRVSVADVKESFSVEAGGPSDSSLRAESKRR